MKAVSKPIRIVLLALVVISGLALARSDLFFQIKKQLTIFSDVFREVSIHYVDEVPPETLMKQGIRGMLSGLDPYTVFVDEGEQQQMEILSSGTYGGVGIEAGYRGDRIVIIAPLEGYPAQRAGLRPGDQIIKINGLAVEGMSPEEVQQLTIGDVGTILRMELRRPGHDQTIEVELERERIEVKNISFAGKIGDNDQFGYVKLTRFGQNTGEELRARLAELNSTGDLEGLILDLRNNPGGLLNEAVEVVDKFIEPGVTVVETRGRYENQNNVYTTDEPALFEDMPIVVVMNSGSASASEVVAGALQDLDRAVVVGETSFGKGLVQTVRPLSYNTSLKITVSQYFTPSGRGIQSMDYARYSDEGGIEVADSLRRAFRTKNGRTVFDGQGIEPDIKLEGDRRSLLEIALKQENEFFFFISDRLAEGRYEEGALPESLYRDFTRYLVEKGFSFETPVDQHIEALENNIDRFSSETGANEHISELKALLRDYKVAELYDQRSMIERELRSEWYSQTLEGENRERRLLDYDPYITRSTELLSQMDQYMTILRP
ncbi:MAG: S41 family peptidase [Balneolaceae bacterium]|nr:S41 family peptidase [Balneolaceae bacterium]MCH8547261.1 S41 family peptidase [Balneolaceae bacterium]